MGEVSGNGRNPLEDPEILENILEFLPLEDQKSSRLVNKFWRKCGIAPMKKKQNSGVRVGYQGYPEDNKTIEDLDELSKCLNSVAGGIANFPCSKFFFSPSLIRSDRKHRNEDAGLVADFLQNISPLATELWLSMDAKKRVLQAAFPQRVRVQFPKLKLLKFSTYGTPSRAYKNSAQNFYNFVTHILEKAPSLQKVYFTDDDDQFSVDTIIKAKSSFTELQIYKLSKSNASMEKFSRWGREVKLKSLDLSFLDPFSLSEINGRSLSQFLGSQNESLERLVLSFYAVSSPVTVTFPEMPKLRNLTIEFDDSFYDEENDDDDDDEENENTHDLITFPVISYQRQFPALSALHLNHWNEDEIPLCKRFINKDMEPLDTLEELRLPISHFDGESLITAQNALRVFPNVKKLTTQADSGTLPTIFEHWTNLEQLTLHTVEHDSIDYLLMGHSRSGYNRLEKRIERERDNFDWNRLVPGNAAESIVNLQKLRVLTFINGNDESRELEVTRTSLQLILSRMGSLRCVDFGERWYPMETKIDKAWWAQLNEDCVVLWKNANDNI